MSAWIISDTSGRDWLTLTRALLLTRLMIVIPAVGAVFAQQFAAPSMRLWPAVPVLALALLTALSPDSVRGALFLTAYAVWWLRSETDETTLWSLAAAVCLLAFHAAVAFAASGPRGVEPDRRSVLRWLRDTGLVAMATWGMWLLVAGLHGSTSSGEVLVGICLVLVAVLVMLAKGPPPAGPLPIGAAAASWPGARAREPW